MRQYLLLLASIFVSRCLASGAMESGPQGGLDEDKVSSSSGTSMPNTYSYRPHGLMSVGFESIINRFEHKVEGFNSAEGMSLDEFKRTSYTSISCVSSMYVEYAKMAAILAIGISTKDTDTIGIYGLMLLIYWALYLNSLETCGHARKLLENLSNVSVDTQAQASSILGSSAMKSDLTTPETISGEELATRNGFADQELRTRISQLARYVCQIELACKSKDVILFILLGVMSSKIPANIRVGLMIFFLLATFYNIRERLSEQVSK